MITFALAALMSLVGNDAEKFRTGAWEGSCTRIQGENCVEYEVVNEGPVTLRFVRNANSITVYTEPSDCNANPRRASINPSYSPTTMSHLIRGRVVMALYSCQSKLNVPALLPEDIADILRKTEFVSD